TCKVALAYSGHVRSFAHPRVYLSHMKHLVEPLRDGEGCQVDIFMYLSVEDEVDPSRRKGGVHSNALAFESYTPDEDALERVLHLFKPVSVVYHQQEQAGYIRNPACAESCHANAYWQLYKMAAVHRMVERHEEETGQRYTWVVRSRLDIGWMRPLAPLRRFPQTRIYVGHNFFPIADQFALCPRQYSPSFFGAIALCFSCPDLQSVAATGVSAQTEHLLWAALRRASAPYGYYEFPLAIVRYHEGGVCHPLHPYKLACPMLEMAGLLTTGWDSTRCSELVTRWHRGACYDMFP
ncbi:unnamed protein product, partial [Discosporangium mesarthrocarpum]